MVKCTRMEIRFISFFRESLNKIAISTFHADLFTGIPSLLFFFLGLVFLLIYLFIFYIWRVDEFDQILFSFQMFNKTNFDHLYDRVSLWILFLFGWINVIDIYYFAQILFHPSEKNDILWIFHQINRKLGVFDFCPGGDTGRNILIESTETDVDMGKSWLQTAAFVC